MNLDSLEAYCETIGVAIQVVPEGTDLKPPKDKSLNLGLNPDLEKEMELLDYLFAISESDDSGMDVDMAMDHETVSQGVGGGGSGAAGAWE